MSGRTRFILTMIPGIVLFLLTLMTVGRGVSRMPGFLGVCLSLGGGILISLGLLLAWSILRSFFNLMVLRGGTDSPEANQDGKTVAVEGEIETSGDPTPAPIEGTACAAYTYVISKPEIDSSANSSSGSRRVFLAQGFGLLEAGLRTSDKRLPLLAMPTFGEELRKTYKGKECLEPLTALLDSLEKAPAADMPDREGALLEARHSSAGPGKRDYRLFEVKPKHLEDATAVVEILPVSKPVTVIAQYRHEPEALHSANNRLEPGLIVFEGTRTEVIERLGKDVRVFGITALVMISLGIGLLAIPLTRG